MTAIDVHADLELGVKIGQLSVQVDALTKAIVLQAKARRLSNTLTCPTSVQAPFIVSLGGPSAPVFWDVREVVVTGADDHTSVANVTAAIYAGQQEQSIGQVARVQGQSQLTDLRWPNLTVP